MTDKANDVNQEHSQRGDADADVRKGPHYRIWPSAAVCYPAYGRQSRRHWFRLPRPGGAGSGSTGLGSLRLAAQEAEPLDSPMGRDAALSGQVVTIPRPARRKSDLEDAVWGNASAMALRTSIGRDRSSTFGEKDAPRNLLCQDHWSFAVVSKWKRRRSTGEERSDTSEWPGC